MFVRGFILSETQSKNDLFLFIVNLNDTADCIEKNLKQ